MGINAGQMTAYASDLRRYANGITPKAETVVAAIAHRVEAAAKQRAAVDTGDMRDSIGVDVQGLEARIGPTVSYAPYVEFGHATRGGRGHVAPRPFMGPAVDANEPIFYAALEKIAEFK